MKRLLKKSTRHLTRVGATITAGFVLLFSPISLMPAQPAHAQWVVEVAADIPATLGRMADALAWAAAKTAIQSMTQSIVNWINSGFEGSPAFVTDLSRNLGNLADAVAEDFIRGLDQVVESNTGISIRAPFQDQIARALRAEFYRTTSSYGFDVRHPYQDCYRGGGFSWNGFLCESRDANNPYGRYMIARNELFARVDKESQNRIQELTWGNGFLSWRGPCGPYANKNPALEAQETGTSQSVSLNQQDRTVGCSIRTPGAVIEDQLVGALGSPIRQLEIADSVNEIVAALMTQMVNQVLGGSGLTGVSQPSASGGRSYLDRATDPSASISGSFPVSASELRTEIIAGQAGWQRVRTAASSAAQACVRDSSRAAQANEAVALADRNLTEATAALSQLSNLETERTRLSGSSSSQTEIEGFINRYRSLLSSTGVVAKGAGEGRDAEGTLYRQMTELARECR